MGSEGTPRPEGRFHCPGWRAPFLWSSQVKPLCCVLMPSGKKRLPAGPQVDFEAVYSTLVEPGSLRVL